MSSETKYLNNQYKDFFEISLEPNVITFASLCNLDNFVDFVL